MPKSSVHALFGSKEDLQVATITAARDSFVTEVVTPASSDTEPGRQRLLALCDGYLSYVQRRIFPGGCFFVAASAEMGARTGRVHDEVVRVQQQWRDLLDKKHGLRPTVENCRRTLNPTRSPSSWGDPCWDRHSERAPR